MSLFGGIINLTRLTLPLFDMIGYAHCRALTGSLHVYQSWCLQWKQTHLKLNLLFFYTDLFNVQGF